MPRFLWTRVIIPLVAFSLWSFAPCSAQDIQELGFEEGKQGATPAGWKVPVDGWKCELTEEQQSAGKLSAKLFLDQDSKAPFGNFMRTQPAEPFAGGHVKLTATIRVEGDGRGQMWLRVDRHNGTMGAFDNMGDRPVLAGDWSDATIEADIEQDAAALNIGFMAIGNATLFIDDVKLQVSNDRTFTQELSPPLALTPRERDNLVAAAKLLSYIRFFHPSDQAVGVASWDHVAVEVMEQAGPATDAADLASRLTTAFQGIAPSVQVWAGSPADAPAAKPIPEEATKQAWWQHFGAGSVGPSKFPSPYRSSVKTSSLEQDSDSENNGHVVKELGGGVSCRIPVRVPANDDGTLPTGATPDVWSKNVPRPKLTALNRNTRLAGVALAWGVFQHFYPYFDNAQIDWEAALPAALAKAAIDRDESEYLNTLREMVAKLQDGHGNVRSMAVRSQSVLPIAVEWAGEDLVVVGKRTNVPADIEIGDAIISIDGRAIQDCYQDVSKWISAATDGWRRAVAQSMLLANLPTNDPAAIVFRKPTGKTIEAKLARGKEWAENTATTKNPENGTEVAPGVVYFNLNRAETAALAEALPKLVAAKGVIFDLRGYPGSAGVELMRHLIDKPATSARWGVPIVHRPDREDWKWQESGRWRLAPKSPRISGEIVFLTGGGAISYAESIMGIVEHYQFGEIVGSTTAGTNGNINPFSLPGGFAVTWTGMRVLKHDGSRHHGVGIAPTIPVHRTAAGIAAGRDEVLDAAVKVLQSKFAK